MTPEQAAEYLNLSVAWLARMRLAGGDSRPYLKNLGVDSISNLDAWLESHLETGETALATA